MTLLKLWRHALLVTVTVPVFSAKAQHHSHTTAAPEAVAIRRIPGPAVLRNESRAPKTVEVTITVEPTLMTFVPGKETASYTYNGRIPGPTLEIYEGDRVIVHFR